MAGSVNKVILVGNLGADPEVRAMQTGDRVVNLSVATSERWRDRASGEMRDRTEWHRVVIFNQNLVTVAEQYLKKGSKVYLEGQLQTRKWTDQSGMDRYSTEVVLSRFRGELTMLDSRSDQGRDQGGNFDESAYGSSSSAPSQQASAQQAPAASPVKPQEKAPSFEEPLDDDIPF